MIRKKVEVLCLMPNSDEPEIYYLLPSGYKDSEIEVYESAYEQLEVRLVPKDKWGNEKDKAGIRLEYPFPAPKTIHKDITEVDEGIICHQINCRGVMGAGLAKRIREKFPQVYKDYMYAFKTGNLWLGNVLITSCVSKSLNRVYVASLCGQHNYGRDKQYTDYPAVEQCLKTVQYFKDHTLEKRGENLPVYIPFSMGCTLGGGDWFTVENIIKQFIPDAVIAEYSQNH